MSVSELTEKDQVLDCFSEEHKSELVHLGKGIGAEALDRVLVVLGGQRRYLPTPQEFWAGLSRQTRNEKIRAEFCGNNLSELAKKHRLSKSQIRRIVCEK